MTKQEEATHQTKPETREEQIGRIDELDWTVSKQYVLKSFPHKIYHALYNTMRVLCDKKVVPPGKVFVINEGDFKCATPDVYTHVEFTAQFRAVTRKDADLPVPTPEDELEAYEPEIREVDKQALSKLFTHHEPDADQSERLVKIRAAGRHFAAVVVGCTPRGDDQHVAVRNIRAAVMFAEATVVLEKPKGEESQ